jgi:hypothetical protein
MIARSKASTAPGRSSAAWRSSARRARASTAQTAGVFAWSLHPPIGNAVQQRASAADTKRTATTLCFLRSGGGVASTLRSISHQPTT